MAGAAYWYVALQTYHLATVTPGVLYRDGNRGLREFTHGLAMTHAKTVVSLIDEREATDPAKPQFAAEADLCSAHNVRQVRIPVKLGGWPTSVDVQRFLAIVSDPTNQPVLLHCAQGVRRTGMFVAAYQMSTLHETPAQAQEQVLTFGHKPRDVDDVRTFIARYDPKTESLPTTMPVAASRE